MDLKGKDGVPDGNDTGALGSSGADLEAHLQFCDTVCSISKNISSELV